MDCVILCGGFGKRIYKYYNKTPKVLININNKPFIYYKLKQVNFCKKIYLCTGYKGNQVKNYFKDKKSTKIFIKKEKEPLGTGGPLKKIIKSIKDDKFFFTYGDNYLLDLPIKKMIDKFNQNKKSLILIYKNNNIYDKSNIKLNSKKNIVYNKSKNFVGNFIDYGFFLLNKNDIIKNLPNRTKFDFSYLLNVLIKKKLIQYIIVKKRFYEIGKIDGLREFEKYIKEKTF